MFANLLMTTFDNRSTCYFMISSVIDQLAMILVQTELDINIIF
jgi:hypothetical protein